MDFDGHDSAATIATIADVQNRLREQIVLPEGGQKEVELTPEVIDRAERIALIQAVAVKLDSGEAFSSEEVKALAERYYESTLSLYKFYDEYDEDDEDEEEKGWLQINRRYPSAGLTYRQMLENMLGTSTTTDSNEDHISPLSLRFRLDSPSLFSYAVPPHVLDLFPDGIHDLNDEDALEYVLLNAFEQCNDEDKPVLFEYILTLYDTFPIEDPHYFMRNLLRACFKDTQHIQAMMVTICEYLYHSIENGEVGFRHGYERTESHVNDFVDALSSAMLGRQDAVTAFIDNLLSNQNRAMHRDVVRLLVDRLGFAPVINGIRECLTSSSPEQNQAYVEEIGRWLMGFGDDVSFHTSLNEVYQHVHFEDYEPNIAAQEREESQLLGEISRVSGVSGHVVDLGCGTGRLSNRLAEIGVDDIVGIDISDTNLAKAQEHNPDHKVAYKEASWLTTGLESDSSRLVYSLGRSLSHAEQEITFRQILQEVQRILADGGVFYFDMPNPDKGKYLEARQAYLHNVQGIGISYDLRGRDAIQVIDTIIDSPDGINFYNRFVPDVKRIIRICHDEGFEVEEVGRAQISANDESETIYFRAEKRAKSK